MNSVIITITNTKFSVMDYTSVKLQLQLLQTWINYTVTTNPPNLNLLLWPYLARPSNPYCHDSLIKPHRNAHDTHHSPRMS